MRFKIAFLLGLTFFIAGIITLSHYGINWDTINHLPRGQAYLHYFLTGHKDYSDLPKEEWYWQNPDSLKIDTDVAGNKISGRSYYQMDATTFEWFMQYDGGGHPPLSDILSSLFNRVLFGKLRLVNDIDSYRVYGIVLSAFLVGLVFYWTSKSYGNLAGFIASVSLATYPLFWAESHFNTEKDIPEVVYWSFFLFSFYQGMVNRSWKWVLASGLFFGLALGTKFNILFAGFVILPWIVAYFVRKGEKLFLVFPLKLWWSLVMAVTLGVVIFLATWPYLWPDLISRIGSVINFYREIGLTVNQSERFLGPLGINTYPLQWIISTTPPLVLFMAFLGIIVAVCKLRRENNKVSLLFLLWFVVPIARVVWPGTTIYGGVRQIMEYIPAMTVLAGLGGKEIIEILSKWIDKKSAFLIVILPFAFLILNLAKIHPNENVYFNFLMGGLSGAKEKGFPYWGFSFGSPYRQASAWIDKYTEVGANVVYTYDLIPNIPRIWLRRDLNFNNSARSGYLRRGEYAMGLVYEGTSQRSYYDSYLEKFIEPVYEEKVDGVAVVKVWKNDDEHLKTPWREVLLRDVSYRRTDYGLRFDLGEVEKLSRLEVNYFEGNCKQLTSGSVQISKNEKEWQRLPGVLPDDWRISFLGEQPKGGKFIEPFVGQEARFVDLVVLPMDTCLKNVSSFKLFTFE